MIIKLIFTNLLLGMTLLTQPPSTSHNTAQTQAHISIELTLGILRLTHHQGEIQADTAPYPDFSLIINLAPDRIIRVHL